MPCGPTHLPAPSRELWGFGKAPQMCLCGNVDCSRDTCPSLNGQEERKLGPLLRGQAWTLDLPAGQDGFCLPDTCSSPAATPL